MGSLLRQSRPDGRRLPPYVALPSPRCCYGCEYLHFYLRALAILNPFLQVEDGAVLGNLFSRVTSASQIPFLLQAYENLRLKRTANTQASSRLNQVIFHLEDGPEQIKRDASMKAAMNGEEGANNANQWADKKKSATQFGYDADEAVNEWWAAGGKEAFEAAA